jgi:hypothetical protein
MQMAVKQTLPVCFSTAHVYDVQRGVYVSLKAGLNCHPLSISGLPPHTIPYNHDIRLLLPHAASFPTSHSTIVIEMSFFSETGDEKHGHVSFDSQEVDTGAQLDASIHTPLDPGEFLRIR